jgi:hypothetical protein
MNQGFLRWSPPEIGGTASAQRKSVGQERQCANGVIQVIDFKSKMKSPISDVSIAADGGVAFNRGATLSPCARGARRS